MEKDFNGWNEYKKDMHWLSGHKLYRVRDMWWCHLGVNVGSEQDGTGNEYENKI